MKTKKFDCVQMKRQGAAKVREQTASFTRAQLAAGSHKVRESQYRMKNDTRP
jgi:hypothetical protein